MVLRNKVYLSAVLVLWTNTKDIGGVMLRDDLKLTGPKLDGNVRISARQLKEIRIAMLDQQGWCCSLCGRNMKMVRPAQRCVDHSHAKTGPDAGALREVLCSNCNGNEGRIKRRVLCAQGSLSSIEWLENLLNYWKKHSTNQTGLIHHTHKTPDEARLLRNKRARLRRAKKKGK